MSKILTKQVISAIDKLNAIKQEIGYSLLEKEELLDLIALALVGKRNLFILGKKGQAKTKAIDEFAKRITNANYFKTVMNKLIDKDELFYRLDIPSMVKGEVKVITDKKIPEANITMLDEIFKSNEVILNSLLSSFNHEPITLEGTVYNPPIISHFSASNEIPNFKKEEDKILEPLYDRLHLKIVTNYIENRDNYKLAIKRKRESIGAVPKNTMTLEELTLLNEKVTQVEVTEAIDDLFWEICEEIKRKLNVEISDRRKIEMSVIIQSQALISKREVTIPEDLKILKYYLWDDPNDIDVINEIITRYSENPLKDKFMSLKAMAIEILDEALKSATSTEIKTKNRAFNKAEKEIFNTHSMLEKIESEVKTLEDKKMFSETLSQFDEIYSKLNKAFGFSEMTIREMKDRQGLD